MYRRINNTAGFTILELLVSIMIFVVILMAMAGFSTLLIRTNGANEVRNAAVKTALDKLHQVEFLQFSSIPTSSADFSSGFFLVRDTSIPYRISLNSSSAANMKNITETMHYSYRSKNLSFPLSTIVLKP